MTTLSHLWRDLTLAARSLARARAFTVICVLSLGIGMAPVIAVPYGTGVLLAPPPGLDTSALVEIVTAPVGSTRATDRWSYPDYIDLREAATSVSMTGWTPGDTEVILPSTREGRVTPALFVSSNYFRTIGVAMAQGTEFPDGTDAVVILGHDFWQRALGADPDVVGKTLVIDDVPHAVVGITPASFSGHLGMMQTEVFLPIERHPRLLADTRVRFDRSQPWIRIHGRLLPGVPIDQARATVAAVTSQLAQQYAATNASRAGVVEAYHPIGSLSSTEVRVVVTVWQVLTLLPLLVVCLNISGMVQVRSALRERELSIRQAIGATRGRLRQHLLAEAVVLAALGGALAALVIFNIAPLMSWWIGEPIPARLQAALAVDLRMIAICAGLCLGTSLLFGWLPASRFSRPVILTVLKDEAGNSGIRVGRVHRVAAALQVAIAVPLLVTSGMSLERVRATATSDLGFASDLLYAAPIPLEAGAGAADARIRRVRDNLSGAGGIASVTVADGLPLDFTYRLATVSLEATAESEAPPTVRAHVTRVGEGYLDTMGIPLLGGRAFTPDDGPGAELVTIISRPLADRLFPGAAAGGLGQRITFTVGQDDSDARRVLTVVGIAADFPTSQMSTDREQLLLPLAQYPAVRADSVPVDDDRGGSPTLMIVARSATGESPARVTAAIERALRDLDPDFRPSAIVTGVSLREHSMSDFLTQSAVGGFSGGVILLLAALGIYGVVGMMVSARTREIAVRMAMGASRPRIIGMILFDVLKLVAPGVGIGLLLATALVRLNGGILGLPLSDLEPLAYVTGIAAVVLIAMLASLAPARRAASVQPMVAMRSV